MENDAAARRMRDEPRCAMEWRRSDVSEPFRQAGITLFPSLAGSLDGARGRSRGRMLGAAGATSAAVTAPRIRVRPANALRGRTRRGGHGARTRAASFPPSPPRRPRDVREPAARGLGRDDAVDVHDDEEEEEDDESSSIAEPSPAEPGDASRDASPSSGASSSPASNPNPFAAWSRRLQRSVVADDRRGVPFRVASAADIASALANARALLGERTDIAGEMARAIEKTANSRRDVGWLARDPTATPALDGTARFEEILHDVRRRPVGDGSGSHIYEPSPALAGPDAPAYLLVPGLFGDYYPGYMSDVRDWFVARGARCKMSCACDTEGTVRANARALAAEVTAWRREMETELLDHGDGRAGTDSSSSSSSSSSDKRTAVVLIGHSKGGVDACAACAEYAQLLRGVVRGIVTTQAPYAGSFVSSDLLATPALESLSTAALEVVTGTKRGEGETLLLPAVRDLTYASRRTYLASAPRLDVRAFPVVSFHTETKHFGSLLFLPAAYARNRYGVASDGLVARCDAEVPGAVCVRWTDEQDHADCAYPREVSDGAVRAHRASQRMARRAAPAAGEVTTGEAVDADADGGGGNERGWAAGEALVRARAALERATPERLRGVASPGEYHEALATLLLEQPWDPNATFFLPRGTFLLPVERN